MTADALTKRLNAAERERRSPPITVRDAASLIILDRANEAVLMGRRSDAHAFFPGSVVFPGGRVDPTDARVPAAPYRDHTMARLTTRLPARHGPPRARALGIAALREAYEETGVFIAREAGDVAAPRTKPFAAFAQRNLALDLGALTFLVRAVTPPRRPRRYDTRFFVVDRSAIADTDPTVLGPGAELQSVDWIAIDEAKAMALPAITLTVLDELTDRLRADPDLAEDHPVPYYRWHRTAFTRELI